MTESIESVYAYWVFPTFTKEKPKGPEVVVAPEGLETEEWAISATTNFGDPVYGYLNIGFDGNDVYLQGLCTYLPEAWIKGTLNGETITFKVPVGKVITKLVFNAGKWNEGNTADTGSFEGSVWTGEAKKVVMK